MCSINLPTATPAEKIVSAAATAPKISKAIIIAESLLPFRFPYGFLSEQRVTVPLERANRLPFLATPLLK